MQLIIGGNTGGNSKGANAGQKHGKTVIGGIIVPPFKLILGYGPAATESLESYYLLLPTDATTTPHVSGGIRYTQISCMGHTSSARRVAVATPDSSSGVLLDVVAFAKIETPSAASVGYVLVVMTPRPPAAYASTTE